MKNKYRVLVIIIIIITTHVLIRRDEYKWKFISSLK